jgi:UDP:flavonoid glycosyltransferase YjiC (YdhE family)
MGNILLLTQGTGGDVFPFIKIGQSLKARGHQVTLIVNRPFMAQAESLGLDCASADDLPPFREWSANENLTDSVAARQRYLMQKTLRLLETIRQRAGQKNSILIGHYGLHLVGQMAADKFAIPYIPIFTAPYFMLNTAILGEMYRTNSLPLNRMRAGIDLPPISDWDAWLRRPLVSIGLWPEWFAAPGRDWPAGLEMAGFVASESVEQGELPPDLETFLRHCDEPPVLITHGTSVPSHAEFFAAGAEACARLGRGCIIVTNEEKFVPATLEENARHYKYLPFGNLMPRMGAIIHHGGIGTTSRAFAAGIRQLILPFGSDRPDNASRLKHLGGGDYLPPARWSPAEIAGRLKSLMSSATVRESCLSLSRRLDKVDSAVTACRIIESVLDGTHPEPAASSLSRAAHTT